MLARRDEALATSKLRRLLTDDVVLERCPWLQRSDLPVLVERGFLTVKTEESKGLAGRPQRPQARLYEPDSVARLTRKRV